MKLYLILIISLFYSINALAINNYENCPNAIPDFWTSTPQTGQCLVAASVIQGLSLTLGQYNGIIATTSIQNGVKKQHNWVVIRPVPNPDSELNIYEHVCNSTFVWEESSHTCVVDVDFGVCAAGQTTSSGYYNVGDQITSTPNILACTSGCTVIFQGSGAFREIQNGVYNYFFIGQYDQDGTTCSSSETESNYTDDPPTVTCGIGQVSGTINDETICVTASTGDPVNPYEPPPTTTDTETTTENTADNGDGTSTTTTTTTSTGSNGGTSTTTTTTNTDNSTGDTITSTTIINETAPPNEDPKDTFCEENPDSVICSDSTVTGGATCGSPPVCTGDAIQCAITEQVFLTRCAIEVPDNLSVDESDVNIQAGNDTGLNIDNVFDVEPENIIDLSDPLSGYVPNVLGSCPPPYVFTFRGNNIDLPLTAICDFADLVRPLVLLLAFLSASFIYFNGLIREF